MTMYRTTGCWHRISCVIAVLLIFSSPAIAQMDVDTGAGVVSSDTLSTLESFVNLRNDLQQDIRALNKQIDAAQSIAGKNELRLQLDNLKVELRATTEHFREIAAGDVFEVENIEEQYDLIENKDDSETEELPEQAAEESPTDEETGQKEEQVEE